MTLHVAGFDPGISHFSHVVVRDTTSMPMVLDRGTQKLPQARSVPAEEAYDAAFAIVQEAIEKYAGDWIVGVESFTHRPYVVRRIDSAPRMGAVVAAIELAARSFALEVYEVPPEMHRNTIPRKLYPPGPRNVHERDAYSVAWHAIVLHKAKLRELGRY